MSDDLDRAKLEALCSIMEAAHALAEIAWPRDGCGRSEMPDEGLRAIIDIQQRASLALGLPEDLPLMTGDPQYDF